MNSRFKKSKRVRKKSKIFINKNNINLVEVSVQVYEAFDKFELRDLSELNEYDNHIEHSEIYEETF